MAALTPALGICFSDMLVDHRIVGLKASPSPVDIYLPAIDLCIMVDGEGHFRDSRRAAQEPQECQSEIDNRFNKEAVQKGHKVLRLHYEDHLLYTQIIQVAVRRCRDGIYGSIDFSRAYGADVRTEWNLRLL